MAHELKCIYTYETRHKTQTLDFLGAIDLRSNVRTPATDLARCFTFSVVVSMPSSFRAMELQTVYMTANSSSTTTEGTIPTAKSSTTAANSTYKSVPEMDVISEPNTAKNRKAFMRTETWLYESAMRMYHEQKRRALVRRQPMVERFHRASAPGGGSPSVGRSSDSAFSRQGRLSTPSASLSSLI